MINVYLYEHMNRKLGNPFKIFVRSFRSGLSKVRKRMSIREKEYDQSTLCVNICKKISQGSCSLCIINLNE
jgi:hypothetical protein